MLENILIHVWCFAMGLGAGLGVSSFLETRKAALEAKAEHLRKQELLNALRNLIHTLQRAADRVSK